MSEAKHTQGPWGISDPNAVVIRICAKQGGEIAVVYDSPQPGNRDEHKANARLIAAAPEFLDAAENTVAYYAATQPGRVCLNDELNPCGGLRHWGGGSACPLCSSRAAIAKVKGSAA